MVNCYYCGDDQVWDAKPKTNFFYCENSDCGKAFCTLCNGPVDNDRDERETEQEQIEYEEEEHPICFEFKDMRNEWNLIMQKGAMRFCPNPSCKTGGVKGTEWTHMKWFTWGTNYCYFWGKAEADCNKSTSEPGLARHNDDWETNPKRCPIFLLQIQEVDDRWETNKDDDCMKFFHKLLTYTYISEFIKKHTRDTFGNLCDAFDILSESGINIDEVLSTDLTMIKRD